MRFFLSSLSINLKRILTNPLFVCAALILIASILCFSFFIGGKSEITVNIGFLAEEPDIVTERLSEILLSNRQINFIKFEVSQKDEMTERVMSRNLECAYIFNSNFGESLKNERFENTIKLITSPATIAHGMINETVFAAAVTSSADILSAEITANMLTLNPADISEEFTEKIEGYHETGIFLKPELLHENEYAHDIQDLFALRALRGVFIIVIFIFAYFLIPRFIQDKNEGLFKMLSSAKFLIYYLSQFLASFLSMFSLGVLSWVVIKICVPHLLFPVFKEVVGGAAFLACVSSAVTFCVLLFKNSEPLYAGFVFVLAIQVIFGNLFLNLEEISLMLGRFQVLPSAYYMNYLLTGGSLAVPVILSFAFILLGAVIAMHRKHT
ncbi:MAG: ABC transporter permease [Clostridiales bacterium]|nr:ABC transporter permease [Clostridiales bacterium]